MFTLVSGSIQNLWTMRALNFTKELAQPQKPSESPSPAQQTSNLLNKVLCSQLPNLFKAVHVITKKTGLSDILFGSSSCLKTMELTLERNTKVTSKLVPFLIHHYYHKKATQRDGQSITFLGHPVRLFNRQC